MASATAGDDWGFVVRILALLPEPVKGAPKHLLIVDAVEGLEAMSGGIDTHGHERSRRSRIAQLLRTAGTKCHIALVLEESHEGEVQAEEFVTDVVLRLWASSQERYIRRTLEIVKSRGGVHVRGRHDYVIRPGLGSRIADQETGLPDDPDNRAKEAPVAYIYVFHSLQYMTRERMEEYQKENARAIRHKSYATFDTPKLANVLPKNGLPRGEVTVLTGDEATYKSRFGRAFLSGCLNKNKIMHAEVGVYITSHNLTADKLQTILPAHCLSAPTGDDVKKFIVFRQLEVHSLDSAVLFHIIRRCVEEGIRKVIELRLDNSEAEQEACRRQRWWEYSRYARWVRVVIDDWAVIKNTYPQIASDPLFLPFLIRYLELKGVTSLIIESAPGRPDQIFNADAERQLRSLVRNHLLTWHVSFYGQDRVAIAAVPPLEDKLPSVTAELSPPRESISRPRDLDERLWGDPHFDLYMGLERGVPEPVPLEVYLFSSPERFPEYLATTGALFNRLFTPRIQGGDVVKGFKPADYVTLRAYSRLHGGVRQRHTLVLQVDEYWRPARVDVQEEASAEQTTCYLNQRSTDIGGKRHMIYDSFGVFDHAPEGKQNHSDRLYKKNSFHIEGYPINYVEVLGRLNLIPYYWDFGFLLLHEPSWRAAGQIQPEVLDNKTKGVAAAAILKKVLAYSHAPLAEAAAKDPITWHEFLYACKLVSQLQAPASGEALCPLDLDLLSPQTFACLIMEMWWSEIADGDRDFPFLMSVRDGMHYSILSLSRLLDKYSDAFFRVWLLIGEVLSPKMLLDAQGNYLSRPASTKAVAARHWYSTGSRAWQGEGKQDFMVPARLPGHFSTRGDWFLVVGSESRSVSLGERAVDLLSRRQENITRLELGIGLPVRELVRWLAEDAKDANKKWIRKDDRDLNDERRTVYEYLGTPFVVANPENDQPRALTYGKLLEMGALEGGPLRWLWRSQIYKYDRDDRVWEQILSRFLAASQAWQARLIEAKEGGFAAYRASHEKNSVKTPAVTKCREEFDQLLRQSKNLLPSAQ